MGHPSPPPGKPRFSAPKVYGAKPRSPQGASGGASPVLTGLIVAALYSVVWTLLVYVVHNPVSLAGWGAGGLIGIALARAAREAADAAALRERQERVRRAREEREREEREQAEKGKSTPGQ